MFDGDRGISFLGIDKERCSRLVAMLVRGGAVHGNEFGLQSGQRERGPSDVAKSCLRQRSVRVG